MELIKLKEALTPAQIKDVGSGEGEQEHYMTGAIQSREGIVTRTKTFAPLTDHIKNLIKELVKLQLEFRNHKIEWHDITYIKPHGRKSGALFPNWVSKRRYTETQASFGELDRLRKTIYSLSVDYFNNYHFKLNPKDVIEYLVECGFPKGMKLDTAYLWELNLIVATSDELGASLIRTHSSTGIPTILKSTGLGYNMYLSFIHHQGHICSDKDTSAEARTIWAKLLMSESSVFALVSPNGENSMVISKTILADRNGKEIIYRLANKFFSTTFDAGVSYILETRPDILDDDLRKIIKDMAPQMKRRNKKV